MKEILTTERLILREFCLEDAPFIISLLNSPGWLKYIGDKNINTLEQAEEYLKNGALKSYKENGYGLSLVAIKEDNTPVGMCGIINRDNMDTPDIGFAFLPEFNGLGYGFEIAGATLNYAKTQLKLPKVAAITLPNNTRSIKLLEKIGLVYISPFYFPESEEELSLYST